MSAQTTESIRKRTTRLAIVAGIALALFAASAAGAVELIPSYGLTRAADSDATKSNLGLALRGNLMGPILQSEIGMSYRREEYFDGALKVSMVPVTATLLARPISAIYAGAGVGWYHTKYDYQSPLLADETDQKFGVHVGGGVQAPLAPKVALDLSGRYVFMKDQESKLVPEKFKPDFWVMSLGLAFKL